MTNSNQQQTSPTSNSKISESNSFSSSKQTIHSTIENSNIVQNSNSKPPSQVYNIVSFKKKNIVVH
jgi:hypothetical protein